MGGGRSKSMSRGRGGMQDSISSLILSDYAPSAILTLLPGGSDSVPTTVTFHHWSAVSNDRFGSLISLLKSE